MNTEWKHFLLDTPPIGIMVRCYDSISDVNSIGFQEDEEMFSVIDVPGLERDSAMDFWKPLEKPSQEVIDYYKKIIEDN